MTFFIKMTIQTEAERFEKIIKLLCEKGAIPSKYGSTRAVLVRGDYIYKVPVSSDGIKCNQNEAAIYKARATWIPDHFRVGVREHVRLAKCRIIWMYGSPVLVMEKLTIPPKIFFDIPTLETAWTTAYMFDGRQVGLNKHKELVAYDFSPPLGDYFSIFMTNKRMEELGFTMVNPYYCYD